MVRAARLGALLAALWPIGAARAADPHNSFDKLVSANGWGAVTYDVPARRIDGFYEHVYRYASADVAATETRDFLYDSYFGIRVGAEATWLTEVPIDEVGYEPGTGILRTVQRFGGLRIETFLVAPRACPGPALAMSATVSNAGAGDSPPVSLFTIHNFHMGAGRPEPGSGGERITWSGSDGTYGSYAESGPSGAVVVLRPLGPATRHACSPNNPYPVVPAGGDFVDTADSGVIDDAVSGFQFDLGAIGPGLSQSRGVLVGFDPTGDAAAARRAMDDVASGPALLLDTERDYWEHLAGVGEAMPASLSPGEAALWRQSEVVLLMAQVRESGRGFGQIVASLPPGQWNISWVRDMCYAVVGLVRSGHFEEARDALRFMLEADVGEYESYVGMPYRISVTRYFGEDGLEESDWNEDGPNIEFDGFGLFLWALGELAGAWDDSWWEPYWPAIRDEVADVLLGLRDPSTGLVAADSSIWEVHWNGRQRRFAYTSLAAARGLCAASGLAERLGDGALAAEYRDGSTGIRDAVLARLVDGRGVLAQSYEDLLAGSGYHDAAVVEALNWGLVRPGGRVGSATLDSIITHLTPPSGRGFFRNDDGGWYDDQEWVFVDLRAANAFRLAGRSAVADDLLGWVTWQSSLNYDLIAELYGATTADYEGSVPMAGFGAGAYILALADRAAGTVAEPACGEWPADPPDADAGDAGEDGGADADAGGDAPDAGGPGAGTGCGCRAAGGGDAQYVPALLVLLVAFAAARRRRR